MHIMSITRTCFRFWDDGECASVFFCVVYSVSDHGWFLFCSPVVVYVLFVIDRVFALPRCSFPLPAPHSLPSIPHSTALSPAASQPFHSSRSVVSYEYTTVSCTAFAAWLLSIVCFKRYYSDCSSFSTVSSMRTREFVGLEQLPFARALVQNATRFLSLCAGQKGPAPSPSTSMRQLGTINRASSRLMLCL